jgi:hypothetical protein
MGNLKRGFFLFFRQRKKEIGYSHKEVKPTEKGVKIILYLMFGILLISSTTKGRGSGQRIGFKVQGR